MEHNIDMHVLGMVVGVDRRSLAVSAVFIGLTISSVIVAYFTLGDASDDSDIAAIHFAAIIFRHGERSPSKTYQNDPHVNHPWIGGAGALAPRGALQMYNLGTKLAKRYRKLVPSNGFYTTNELYVLSSAHERCLMSGQSFMAGFLPAPANNSHALPINWQPVAISSVPRDSDMLVAQKAKCPRYDRLLHQMYADPPAHVQDYLDSIKELFAYCQKHAGGNITNLNHLESLYDTLLIEELNGLELPGWTREVYPAQLLVPAARNLALLTETDFMKRIKGGWFVTNLYKLMESKEQGSLTPDRKLFIYSGHDVSLVNIMQALNISAQTTDKPDFGATLYFELHKSPASNQLVVKLFYSFHADKSRLKPIEIPNCDAPCNLEQFRKSIDHIYVTDYHKECEDRRDHDSL